MTGLFFCLSSFFPVESIGKEWSVMRRKDDVTRQGVKVQKTKTCFVIPIMQKSKRQCKVKSVLRQAAAQYLQAKLSIPFVLLLRSKPKLDRRGFTNQVICEISPKKSRLFLGTKTEEQIRKKRTGGRFHQRSFCFMFFSHFFKVRTHQKGAR